MSEGVCSAAEQECVSDACMAHFPFDKRAIATSLLRTGQENGLKGKERGNVEGVKECNGKERGSELGGSQKLCKCVGTDLGSAAIPDADASIS